MRALRVVGITEGDGELSVVLEDPDRRERFSVPADEQLRAAARGDLTRLGQIAIELESQLRPREIQARIRAGASVEQVAAAAGVPQQKIERFAYPVLLERSRTAEVAQRAHPVRADGPDTRMLGDVVAHTFGLRGQDYADAEWDSWKGEDGRWVVALSWRAGRSDNRALWTFQPGAHGGTVTAVDEHATDLVEGLPARPLRTVGPVIDIARQDEHASEPTPVEELRATATDDARGTRVENGTRGDNGARTDTSRAPEARTAVEQRPPARTAPEPRRPEPPATRRPEPARQAEPARAPEYARAAEPQHAAEPQQHTAEAVQRSSQPRVEAQPEEKPRVEAPPPAERPEPPAAAPPPAAEAPHDEPAAEAPPESPAPEAPAEAAPAANRRTKKGKPVMPSWDEVLLGVRGQR
ncbi:MAG: hypothetical protein QOF00_1930 [Pseudonocardiales bacterium]|jgi:hypothetical protein|nr:hypothetical protein [Pseudonocardiales bacterium]